jgi:hypothetical protein
MKPIKCLFFFLLFGTAQKIYGQDILDAYIIKHNGDSLQGSVKLPGSKLWGRNVYARLGDGIDFSEKGKQGSFVFYEPKQIKEFGYYAAKNRSSPVRYVSETVYKSKRLVIIDIDGPLRLYKDATLQMIDRNTANVDYYYIKKKDADLFVISNTAYYKVKKRDSLKEYLADCPDVTEILNDKKDLELNVLVKKYNDWYERTSH